MKRKIAFLLAVILIVSTGFMAYATGVDNGTRAAETEQESSTQPGGSVSDSDSENSGLPEDQISGGTEGTGKPENSGNPVPGTDTEIPGAGTGAEIQPPVNGDAAGIGNAAGKAVSMGDIPQDTGEVYVSIGMAQTLYKSAAFQVSLRGSGVDRSDVIQIGGGSAAKSTVQFVGLADGEYTLTVSAQGYATYTDRKSVG